MKSYPALLRNLWAPAVGLLLSTLVVVGLLLSIGESPRVLWEAFRSTLFTGFGLGYTLYYTTPLIFTGLSVAVAFHCGLFNIGAEGQLYFGALGIALASHFFPMSSHAAVVLGVAAALLLGGIWGALPGLLKAARGTHEVIATLLLNFIALSIVDWAILYPLKNPEVQNPETRDIALGYVLPTLDGILSRWGIPFFASTPVNPSLFLAILLAIGLSWFLKRTTLGFELRAAGENPRAARFMGVSVGRVSVISFGLSGALAGLVGVNEVMGNQHKLMEGFSPQYGFTGIAVALLARNHPIGILASALLFGALHNGSRELEFLSEKVTKELSLVIQAILIASVAGEALWRSFSRSKGT